MKIAIFPVLNLLTVFAILVICIICSLEVNFVIGVKFYILPQNGVMETQKIIIMKIDISSCYLWKKKGKIYRSVIIA